MAEPFMGKSCMLQKPTNVVFDDAFRQDLCSGYLLGIESANRLTLAFCLLRIVWHDVPSQAACRFYWGTRC